MRIPGAFYCSGSLPEKFYESARPALLATDTIEANLVTALEESFHSVVVPIAISAVIQRITGARILTTKVVTIVIGLALDPVQTT